ncbi:O-antigen ligase family protein [Mucilaginibacter sp. SP1R1]|uniref:O-antigen ligase family protein n=1 Tax=Mucilaginibacter sp. SP1R1 TaxID=2723091 RepID=UPI00161EF586|nr:O-antigen ligase family protein [Mucilaginibacter sp. SP1R1]MBB6148300.1 O-antigen ligase [Mucilaginibacter sp. SP1R1]
MLQKVLIFALLIIVYLIWYCILLVRKRDVTYLFFSFVITCIPFQMSIPLFVPHYSTAIGTGSFTAKIFLMVPFIASLILLVKQKHKNLLHIYKNENWVLWVLVLILISVLNPYNFARWGTVAFAVIFLSYIFYFRLIYESLNPVQVLNGIFASFLFLCVLQFILAVLYPLMGVSFVTTIFQAGGEGWATRNGTRAGAIGVFVTPANLGLFTVLASGFFFSTYLGGFNKKISLGLLGINSITIVLTYSRTSYITLVVILFALFYLFKNAEKSLFSFKSIFLGLIPALCAVYWLVFFSPFSETFLKTNADEMAQARLDHWVMGLNIFKSSPVIGVGINTHLEFVAHNISLNKQIHNDFLTSNPIHNTHLIILAESGIIGFLLWLLFLIFSFQKAKWNIQHHINVILSLTQIALILTYVVYGFTDWAPLSHSTFPIFLLFTYFNHKYSICLKS